MSVVDPNMDGVPLSMESIEENQVPADLNNLTEYRSSNRLSRMFCTNCAAHMFIRSNQQADGAPSSYAVMWGVLEKTDGIFTIDKHIYVGDTLDGGIADHIRTFDDKPLARLEGWDEKALSVGWKAQPEHKSPETLPLYCHCKTISVYLTRALKPSENPAEYWLVPGKQPTDPIKFIAAHCLCNSCRQTSGGQIQTWAIVPNENIFDAATKAPIELVEPERRPKGLHQYISSDGHHRESCGTCGATVFWWRKMKEGESPHMDVSVGLVDQVAAGGARAESWISWYPRIIFNEFAISKEVAKVLAEGVKASVTPV
ncbi:DUF636 domain-containing protein [Ephemerocybe angulata]|uniref:DUF636 domain-containing protein n=1 Tax=Ephemerocybe angulata TaxID=980116 RepID=A0A8H6IH72_9AGAR|nr:DUF636 domain-containing protein [Tulosesus angulatus]